MLLIQELTGQSFCKYYVFYWQYTVTREPGATSFTFASSAIILVKLISWHQISNILERNILFKNIFKFFRTYTYMKHQTPFVEDFHKSLFTKTKVIFGINWQWYSTLNLTFDFTYNKLCVVLNINLFWSYYFWYSLW